MSGVPDLPPDTEPTTIVKWLCSLAEIEEDKVPINLCPAVLYTWIAGRIMARLCIETDSSESQCMRRAEVLPLVEAAEIEQRTFELETHPLERYTPTCRCSYDPEFCEVH